MEVCSQDVQDGYAVEVCLHSSLLWWCVEQSHGQALAQVPDTVGARMWSSSLVLDMWTLVALLETVVVALVAVEDTAQETGEAGNAAAFGLDVVPSVLVVCCTVQNLDQVDVPQQAAVVLDVGLSVAEQSTLVVHRLWCASRGLHSMQSPWHQLFLPNV